MALDSFINYLSSNTSKKDIQIPITTSKMQHPTGYMYLDYMAGSFLNVYDDDECPLYTYHNIGITEGSVQVFVAKSGCGKTSLAISMAQAIIEPWVSDPVSKLYMAADLNPKVELTGRPFIQICDTEKTLPLDYVKKIAYYRNKDLKRHVMINPITTDKDLMAVLEKHIQFKTSTMQAINMPMNDLFGKPIRIYPPTVLIIDSMSQIVLEDSDDPSIKSYDSMTQNTAGARRAKIVTAIYSKLVNYANKYNIVIFSINHINKAPNMTAMPAPKQYRGLKQGETIGGGERAIYLASGILRLDFKCLIGGESSSAVQLGTDENGANVSGHIAFAKWIKSKSNARANSCQMVYTNIGGYDRLMSTLWNAKEVDELRKSGNFFALDAYPQHRFTMKTARETFMSNPELIASAYNQFRNTCENYLDNPEHARRKEQEMLKDLKDDLKAEVQTGRYSHSDAIEIEDLFNSTIGA